MPADFAGELSHNLPHSYLGDLRKRIRERLTNFEYIRLQGRHKVQRKRRVLIIRRRLLAFERTFLFAGGFPATCVQQSGVRRPNF